MAAASVSDTGPGRRNTSTIVQIVPFFTAIKSGRKRKKTKMKIHQLSTMVIIDLRTAKSSTNILFLIQPPIIPPSFLTSNKWERKEIISRFLWLALN